MTTYVVLSFNNDGGFAKLFPSLDDAKSFVRKMLTEETDPPLDEEELAQMERDLAEITGEYVQVMDGSPGWKEQIYIAPLEESA